MNGFIKMAEADAVAMICERGMDVVVFKNGSTAEWSDYLRSDRLTERQKTVRRYTKSEAMRELVRRAKAYDAEHRGTNWREAFRKQGFAGPTPEQQDGILEDNLRILSINR